MSIFNLGIKQRRQTQEMRKQIELYEKQVTKYQEVQELLVKDILSLQEAQETYVGNDYRDYGKAVQEISDKYNAKAKWGVLTTGICVDLRAAFILGEGIQIQHRTKTRAEAENELEWTKDFFEYNALDGEMAQEIAKEAEIEGKLALKLAYDEEEFRGRPGMVTVRYISWLTKKYKVITDPQDYLWYKELTWTPTGQQKEETISEELFVYKKFGGRLNAPNEAQPKIMRCLTQIDRLDKALRDLREINHLFASPTPEIKVENAAEIDKITEKLQKANWKIGKLLVHTGEFRLAGIENAQSIEVLIKEIETNVKMISGTTGIPIHYLGLLDLLKNRATGDNTRELIMAATTKERAIWKAAYKEIIEKAMLLFNEKAYAQKSTQLDPEKIKVEIPIITQEHWDRIEKVLIPASTHGILSKEYVASQIPGVDLEAEAEKREENEAKEAERGKAELEAIKLRLKEGPEEGVVEDKNRPVK